MLNRKKNNIIMISLSITIFILFFISMSVGRYTVNFCNVIKFIIGKEIDKTSYNVLLYLRLPRTLVSLLIGVSLSISGAIYQSTFRNKLVSPDLLGVSSGASVGACIGILFGFSKFSISGMSFVFGIVTVMITYIISLLFKNKNNIILLLSGIAVGGLMSSFIGLLKYLADDEMKLAEMTYWLLGDISSVTINDFYLFLPFVVICCFLSILFSWRLNIISLGEKESLSLGVKYKINMILMVTISTILTAGSVAISGTIGWIGLVIPNLVRLFVGNNNKKIIPYSILIGGIFMMITDMLARSIAPNEIPLSVITGIIGTPLFIYAMLKRRKEIK